MITGILFREKNLKIVKYIGMSNHNKILLYIYIYIIETSNKEKTPMNLLLEVF